MSLCIFKDEKGLQGARYKRHNIDEETQKCKRCKRPKFVKIWRVK